MSPNRKPKRLMPHCSSRVSIASREAPAINIPVLIYARDTITLDVSVFSDFQSSDILPNEERLFTFDSARTGDEVITDICAKLNLEKSSISNFSLYLDDPRSSWI